MIRRLRLAGIVIATAFIACLFILFAKETPP